MKGYFRNIVNKFLTTVRIVQKILILFNFQFNYLYFSILHVFINFENNCFFVGNILLIIT